MKRRKFLVGSAIGVGVILGSGYLSRNVWRRYLAGFANTIDLPYLNPAPPHLWFEIKANNDIIMHCPKVEMGQGAFTGLAQIAAEELDARVDQIQVIHAATNTENIDQFATGGSTSISSLWQPLRELAATMREMIKKEAAKQLEISISDIKTSEAMVHYGGKSISYGAIASQVEKWTVPKTPPLKDKNSFQYVGKPIARVDLLEKVTGAPIYGMDAELPNMLFGAIARPDKVDAELGDVDISEAEKMPEVVKIVQEKDFVGVVANSYTEAENAKNALKITWKTNQEWNSSDIVDMIQVGKGTPQEIQKKGSTDSILNQTENVIQAEYSSPIGAHAQLEPNGAVASVEKDRATVIISTQVVKLTRDEVAKRLGFKKENINIIPSFLGGGFGRRLHTPHAAQIAVLSKAVGRPVKCFYNRQEEFQNDTFRPPTHHILKAKLSENKEIEALEHHVSSGDVMFGSPLFPGIAEHLLGADLGAWRGGMIQYSRIPNHRAVSWRVQLPFATSWWRSLGLLANTFAIESFMDELANKTGKDPVDFRLSQINDDERGQRLKAVIQAAAEKSNWGKPLPEGHAVGFACSTDVNTPVAQVAEISIEDNSIKVHKVTCAIDPGLIINPDQVRAQCEGAIIMGISAAMFEKMDVVDNTLQPIIYGPYRMAKMSDAPKEIDVVLLENSAVPGAVGEPPLGPIGAAIANAVYQLTGKRVRQMPITIS